MKPTPETDALASDPAIERRDVPIRVWRTMAKIERQRDEAHENLREAYSAIRVASKIGVDSEIWSEHYAAIIKAALDDRREGEKAAIALARQREEKP